MLGLVSTLCRQIGKRFKVNDTTIRRPIQWLSSSATDAGVVRTINEDAIFSKPEAGLWAVADGMGGHEAGDLASNMIIESLDKIEAKTQLNDFVTCIEDCIIDVNNRLLEHSKTMLEGRVIGSTVAILLIKGYTGICIWAGDSRLYRYRNNNFEQLTVDHSLVSELLRDGLISMEEAETHPEANVITRAVGTSDKLHLDIDVFDVRVGDTFLLCSDGLYNAVQKEGIMNCLCNDNIEAVADDLIEIARYNGASDNVSVVLVKGIPSNIY